MTPPTNIATLHSAQAGPHKLAWIQALRGIAALLVVVTHARYYLYGTPWDGFARQFMFPAAQGVDLFFMISGFIMVHTTWGSDGTLRESAGFLARRFARIWPVYAFVVLANALFQVVWNTGLSPWQDVVRSLMFLPVNTDSPPYLGLPVPIGWTLNFEFYFYVVFALSMLAGRWRWTAFAAWMVGTLIVLPWLLAGEVSLRTDHDYGIGIRSVEQIVNPIVWDFAAGVAIGMLYASRIRIARRGWLWLAIACAFAWTCAWSFTGVANFFGMTQWGLPLSFLLAAMALAFKDREPQVPRALLWLGGVSYSLYLWHPYVFDSVARLVEYLGHTGFTHTMIFVVVLIPLPLVYAGISRRYLEDGLAVAVRRWLLAILALWPTRKDRAESATNPA